MEWIVQLPILLFSVVVHALAKGWAAYARGDRTAEEQGRLTLNPIPHIDPFGTVFLPLLCYTLGLPMFGWAKPVPVDAKRLSRRQDALWVALAGPCAHLGLALLMALAYKTVSIDGLLSPELGGTARDVLLFGVSLNLVLTFFNLLPVHPLDGSGLVAGLLPDRWRLRYESHAPYAGYLLAFLLAGRLLDPLVIEPATATLKALSRTGLIG